MNVSGSTFFITGASSGLGEACARRFHAAGGNILLADVNTERGDAVAAELGERARFVMTDVTNEESVANAVSEAVKAFGGISVAINCAGVVRGKRVLGREAPHELDAFQRVININLIGTFNVIRLTAAEMVKKEPGEDGERGVIINTASCAAFEGQVGQAAYSASKAGVAGMTLPIAREFAKFGIRVMTIAPGTFDTPMMGGMTEDVRASLAAQIPFPSRMGQPDEYAQLAEQIVTNRVLNGEVIRLDGALRMGAK